ncbi:hypothetical protein [Streptomyces capoamus]|uniref:hypothetical protein n=1 Tax=Streptomyces capoamus TaxID=68183 RepID=UPI0033935F72
MPGERACLAGGERAARKHDVFLARPPAWPNQVWETDHVQALVLDGVDGKPRRPLITWFTDCATNAITGVAVTLVRPSRKSALAALRSALLRENPYGPFGSLPEKVRGDRGKDFLSRTATAAFDLLEMTVEDLRCVTRELSMLVHQADFTVDLGESGYLIGFTEHDDYPDEMPYGWRCGPSGEASAVVRPTTDTGRLQLTIQIHDDQPARETSGDGEPAEEISLRVETDSLHLDTLDPGEVSDAWPEDEPPLPLGPLFGQDRWVRLRLYCHADDPVPGIGDHGERHLIQLWPAPPAAPVHPALSEEDRRARAEYAAHTSAPVVDYTTDLTPQD